jgi:nitrous oxidase accessory protein NosD
MMLKKRIFIFLLISLFLISTITNFGIIGSAKGEALYVGGGGDGNYSTLQDAINTSSNGDIIFIYKGTYYENIIINKSISLIGENKNDTIINGNNSSIALSISSDYVNITGLTITGGNNTGLLLNKSFFCNIYQNIIIHNFIGIDIIASNNSNFFNNTIKNNSGFGFNIPTPKLQSSSHNIIYHNNFLNNQLNVFDEGTSNNWSFENEGNFYDDYDGLDKNNDGIGDSPYLLSDGGNKDNYPLMMPYYGKIRLKEFYVDDESLYTMLIIGMIVAILFLLPIGFYWYKKTKHLR